MSQVLLREAELELKQLLARQQEVPPTDSALQAEPVGRSDEAVAATESSHMSSMVYEIRVSEKQGLKYSVNTV